VALDPREARAELLVPLADFFTYTPSAKLARQALDSNRDGVVTANELASSGSFQQLTAADLPSGVPGVHQATVSLGIAIEATRVP
jgi:homoserine dehydrogenase